MYMLPPCHFLLYSSNTVVTLTEETNRTSHSDLRGTRYVGHETGNIYDKQHTRAGHTTQPSTKLKKLVKYYLYVLSPNIENAFP